MEWLSSARSKRAVLLVLLAGCSGGGPSAPRITAVSVGVTGYVERSATVTLAVSRGSRVLPADSVQWSAAPSTVGVLQAGQTLQLVDTGTITISATVGDTTATKVLHV